MHLLQSFPGVGPEIASRIWDHFQGVPIQWEITGPEELSAIPGIGKQKASQIYQMLVKVEDVKVKEKVTEEKIF
jgi:ERCC4-type nuclease